MHWLTIYASIGWLIRAAMVPVILRRQMAPGASVAWLGIIFLHPYIGGVLYLIIGETRLGPHRVERHRELMARYRHPHLNHPVTPAVGANPELTEPRRRASDLQLPSLYDPMILQAEKISGMPVLGNNHAEFLPTSDGMIDRLIGDIYAATAHVHLLYYIFAPDSTGERVAGALMDATRRGVTCRLLVDAVASRTFFKSPDLVRRMESAGVRIARALPVAPIQRRLPRMDLRNHRKLAVIDDRVAFAGSHNIVRADYGGRHGAPWIDVTARLTGPVVGELAAVFAEDWGFETSELLDVPNPGHEASPPDGGMPMQVVPTGPSAPGETFRRVFLAAVQSARQRITITTPYFVPDETTLVTLMMAADRGVDVTLLLPLVPDHFFTAAAGRAHFSRLLEAGISICLYKKGLLHVKSTTVDDAFSVFGSANLDVRSFNLNFELTVLLYGGEVTRKLRDIQNGYLADSVRVEAVEWNSRPVLKRYADSAIALLSPLL